MTTERTTVTQDLEKAREIISGVYPNAVELIDSALNKIQNMRCNTIAEVDKL